MASAVLYVVATPIGNLGDMVPRALEVLQSVDAVAVEDTRHSGRLLQHFGIQKPLVPYHDHNEREATDRLLGLLQQQKRVALISDAGMPAIADPGYRLVRQAHRHGIKVEVIPGPCAAIAALAGSGLPTDRFLFAGFLPARTAAREAALETLQAESSTLVFYEAPHRLADTVTSLVKVMGAEREVCLARELSKQYESLWLTTLGALQQGIAQGQVATRGEIVLVVAGQPAADQPTDAEADKVLRILLEELPVKQAAGLAAKITGAGKRELYQRALAWRGEDG